VRAPDHNGYYIAPKARADLEHIYDYTFDTWGETQAEKYLTKLYQAFKKLVAKPSRGKNRPQSPIDLFFFQAEHHVVMYRLIKKEVEIIRVLHERMDAQRHLH